MSETTTELLVLGLLLVLNCLFALAEVALASARKSKLKQLGDGGAVRARLASAHAENPARYLAAMQFGATFCNVLMGAYGGASLARHLNRWLMFNHPGSAEYARFISFGAVVLGLAFATIVVGGLLPNRLAVTRPERWSIALARPIHVLTWFATPVVWLLDRCTDGLVRLLGAHRHRPRPVSEEEVSSLFDQGLSAGVFHQAEKAMVEGVMALDKCAITALMTPRPKMVWLNIDDPDEANWRKIVASGHSHFPVYQQHRDNVLGMVSIKALWANAAFGLPTTLRNLVSPPLIVAETAKAMSVLETFQKSGKHIALVTDEFGGIQGMISLIDILEAIVGDMPDQMRRAQPEAKRRDDGSWLVDATLPTGEIKDLLGLKSFPGEEEAEFQTAGGFVVTQFGRIPAAGDHFDWGGWRFEVIDMDRQRVDKLLISPAPAAPALGEEKASA
ncbi:MAG: hemolysin family protein [Opitutales bacterium]